MRTRFVLSIVPLGLAFAAIAPSTADAQNRRLITVCRDGTRVESENTRGCAGHGDIDFRATAEARRNEERRVADRRGNDGRADPRYDDRRDDRDRNRDDRDRDRNDRNRDDRDRNDRDRNDRDRNDRDRNDRNRDDRGGQYDDRYGSTARNTVYEWQGRVDAEMQFRIRGNRAVVEPIGRNEVRSGRGRIVSALPQREGTLVVQSLNGRGSVDVIEQPSARNEYTATVRVRDPQGGADNYRFVAYWQGSQYGRR